MSLIRNEGIPSRKRKNRLPPHGTLKKKRTERDLPAQERGNTRCIPGDVGSEHAMLMNDSRPLATEPTDLSSLADPSDIFNPNLHTPHAMLVNNSHPPAIEATDLPPWADPFDLFNFDLATPYSMHIDDFPASTNELISQFPVTFTESMPTNATPADPPQIHSQFSIPPPIPFALPSTTTTPASPALAPLLPSTVGSALPLTPASAPPSPTAKLGLKSRRKKTFPCISQNCLPIATTQNSGTAHHHHHQDPKYRFCCRYEACTTRREKTASVTRLRSILSIT